MFANLTGGSGPDPGPRKASGMRAYWRISAIVVGLAVLYSGGVMWWRWHDTRAIEQKQAAERAAKQHDEDEGTLRMMGGGKFDILNFYASPAHVSAGDSVQICYGVSNTKSVTLEPQSNPVWPAYSHCVEVKPGKTTTYTLTAMDASGKKKTSTLVVHVR